MNLLASKISDSELEVMRVLWRTNAALPLATIRKRVSQKCGWEDTTIKTLVSRLVKKGVILQEKREVYYYSAGVAEKEYNEYSTQSLIDKVYMGSAKNLMASLVSNQQLSKKEIAELRALLKEGDGHA